MDVLLLTHGAGTNRDAPTLVAVDRAMNARGVAVVRFDLPFRKARPEGPPSRADLERDLEGTADAVAKARRRPGVGRVFLGGHSYGGRVASLAESNAPGLCDGLLLLSYPLHPPRKVDHQRTAHWPALRGRALFVHGTRDPFGAPDELRAAMKTIPGRREPFWIESVGHELVARRRVRGASEDFHGSIVDDDVSHSEIANGVADAFLEFVGADPVFGERTHGVAYAERPGAYVVARDVAGRIALVDTPKGMFLPGGGVDPDEPESAAATRETLEETGFEVALEPSTIVAVQYVRRVAEGVAYRKRSTFFRGRLTRRQSDGEADHRLVFLEPTEAARAASHGSHADAITRLCASFED